jgi:hypothetical protein
LSECFFFIHNLKKVAFLSFFLLQCIDAVQGFTIGVKDLSVLATERSIFLYFSEFFGFYAQCWLFDFLIFVNNNLLLLRHFDHNIITVRF